MIFEYRCEDCQKVQEVWHKLDEVNIESCEACKAPPEKLKRILSVSHRHVSWSLWKVDGDTK